MATKLYLLSDTHDTNRYKLSTTAGASVASRTVNTAAATQVQWTATAGGSAMEWCSEPLGASATISSAVTFNIWAYESNMNANAGGRARLYKVSNDRATWTEMGGGPFDDNVEFGTGSAANYSWTGTPTSNNALSVGDRIGVRFYLDDNCGAALASGYTAVLTHNGGTGGASGDTWIQTTENLTFAVAQTVNGVAAAVSAAVTAASVTPGAFTVAGATVGAALAVTVAEVIAAAPFPLVEWMARSFRKVRRHPYLRM